MCCFRGLREGIRLSTNPSNIDIIARTRNRRCVLRKTEKTYGQLKRRIYGQLSDSTIPRHKHWPAGPAHFSHRWASSGQYIYLSLARTGHLDICRATRFKIVLARTMTNHSMYFSRGRPSHISAVSHSHFATARR